MAIVTTGDLSTKEVSFIWKGIPYLSTAVVSILPESQTTSTFTFSSSPASNGNRDKLNAGTNITIIFLNIEDDLFAVLQDADNTGIITGVDVVTTPRSDDSQDKGIVTLRNLRVVTAGDNPQGQEVDKTSTWVFNTADRNLIYTNVDGEDIVIT